MALNNESLKKKADQIRQDIIEVAVKNKAGKKNQ